MTSATTQFASSIRIAGMYDRDHHQIGSMWNDPFQVDDSQTTSPSMGDMKLDNAVRMLLFCYFICLYIFSKIDFQFIQTTFLVFAN
jgi:hypothetical protein